MMRAFFFSVIGIGLLVVGGVSRTEAQTIDNLFNTGVGAVGAKVTPANTTTADLHYTMIANNFGSGSSTAFVLQSPNGSWAQSADANYLAPDGGDGSGHSGSYSVTYRTLFTLPANVNLNSVNIAGGWSTDDLGLNILINGVSTGLTSPGFGTFTAFTLPASSYVVGSNTLDFQWQNQGGPGGLDVRFTSKSFTTPEPGSFACLAGMGLAGSVFALRRRFRSPR